MALRLLPLRLAFALGALFLAPLVSAQDKEEPPPKPAADIVVEETLGAQPAESLRDEVNTANNPLADLVSISLHNYYFPRLNGIPDESANTFWLRFVTPF